MFLRGTFARVDKQTILLDQYSNQPSYRVGLVISETVTTAKDDSSLYDNAKGFSIVTNADDGDKTLKDTLSGLIEIVKKTIEEINKKLERLEKLLRVLIIVLSVTT